MCSMVGPAELVYRDGGGEPGTPIDRVVAFNGRVPRCSWWRLDAPVVAMWRTGGQRHFGHAGRRIALLCVACGGGTLAQARPRRCCGLKVATVVSLERCCDSRCATRRCLGLYTRNIGPVVRIKSLQHSFQASEDTSPLRHSPPSGDNCCRTPPPPAAAEHRHHQQICPSPENGFPPHKTPGLAAPVSIYELRRT